MNMDIDVDMDEVITGAVSEDTSQILMQQKLDELRAQLEAASSINRSIEDELTTLRAKRDKLIAALVMLLYMPTARKQAWDVIVKVKE
jgi:hypothetical protein